MKAFTVRWHPERDEITIKYTVDFVESHVITQADILKDALFDLEIKYNEVVEKI
jgi:hypothetical protein